MKSPVGRQIGEVAKALGVRVDTLRYYEKLGLLNAVGRNAAGNRCYDDEDLARLRFIRRARALNFSLAEIGTLLEVRAQRGRARREAQALAQRKLGDIDTQLEKLLELREELATMLAECTGNRSQRCPIIEGIERGLA